MYLKPKLRVLAWLLLLMYLAALLKVVLFKYPPIGLKPELMIPDQLQIRLQYGANFTPFKTIAYYLSGHANTPIAVRNLVGNIVIFSPLGFLIPFALPRLGGVRHATTIAFVTSLFLELVQLLTGLGGFDVDDLFLNVVGGVIGFLGFKGIRKLVSSRFTGVTDPRQRGD